MDKRAFLHSVDIPAGQVWLLWTDAQTLRNAAFIDGRSSLTNRPPCRLPLHQFLEEEKAVPEQRYIFHVGFCGSTLLTRLLDTPSQVLVLREPNCLADIANTKAGFAKQGRSHPLLAQTVTAASSHLARSWAVDEPVVVKPSNWTNNILPELISPPGVRAIFLTSRRSEFLEAVLRGGPARIAFTARAAIHLSSDGTEDASLVAAALGADQDQQGQLARLALVLHAIQLRRFRAAGAQAGWGEDNWLDYSLLSADPLASVERVLAALALSLRPEQIASNISRWHARDAKDPAVAFAADRNAGLTAAIHKEHGLTIAQALDWAERCLPD